MVRWLGSNTRGVSWKKVEFPYRSSTFFSVDLSCAVQQRSTRVGEQKTLYSSNRGQTSHFNCDVSIARCKTSVPRREYLRQPRSKQTTAPPLLALRFPIYPPVSPPLSFVICAPFFSRKCKHVLSSGARLSMQPRDSKFRSPRYCFL